MKCKYCGLSAGFFSHAHPACEEKHKRGISELTSLMYAFLSGNESLADVITKAKSVQIDNFLKKDEVINCFRQGLKNFANTLQLPITKQHVQNMDSFLNNIGIPYSDLNKNGDLDAVAKRFYTGVLSSYFTENEEVGKIRKRINIVTRLLPLNDEVKVTAGLDVLNQAAKNYLSSGLISQNDQTRLDNFAHSFNLPIDNLPSTYNGEFIERMHQSTILRDLQQGIRPQPVKYSIPIMLSSGEFVIWEYTGVTMYQETITKEWVGQRSGWSYRVAKGIYYHTGRSRGIPIEHSSMEKQGIGSLILTNKNVIFYSQQIAVRVPYNKIIGITPYSDGIELQKQEARPKRQVFQGFDSWFMVNLLSVINH